MGIFATMSHAVVVRKISSLTGHTGAVYALSSGGTSAFFSGSGDKVVAEWDFKNTGEGALLARTPEIIYSLFTDFKNERLLVGQAAGGIHVISLKDRIETRLLQYHESPVFHIGNSAKHNLLFTLTGDGKMGVLDADQLSIKSMLVLGETKLRSSVIDSTESQLAVGTGEGTIIIFSLPGMKPVKTIQAHEKGFSVNALQFSRNDKWLISGSRDAHMNIFDVENDFRLHKSIPAHNYAIYSIVYNADHSLMATGGRDKTIKIWDPQTFEVLHRIDIDKNEGHKNSVNKLLWHHESGYLVSGSDDRTIMVWEVKK